MSGSTAPWEDTAFALPPDVPTMITPEEVRYLHWLGRERWSGEDDVVEFGPWLGGSTLCLAAGMAANPRRRSGARLHVVDSFVWQPFMAARAELRLAPGASFRPAFERNLGAHASLVAVHEARLPDEPVVDVRVEEPLEDDDLGVPLFRGSRLPSPVGILFVDGAKSWRALAHMLREVAPRCVPGHTLLVFQDCKLGGAYWIQMGIGTLLAADPPCLELVHLLPFNSVAFRVPSGTDPARLGALPERFADVALGEALALLGRTRSMFEAVDDAAGARTVDVSAIVCRGLKGAWVDAVAEFRALDARWPPGADRADLDALRRWLARTPEAPLRATLAQRASRARGRAREAGARVRRRVRRERGHDLRIRDGGDREFWLEVAGACEGATFFHTPHWADVANAGAARFEDLSLAAELPGGGRVVYPLLRRSRRLAPGVGELVSTFAGCYGGPVATRRLTGDEARRLHETALERSRGELAVTLGPLTTHAGIPPGLSAARDVTHVLRLDRDFDALVAGFAKGHRRAYRRGRDDGVEVRRAGGRDDCAAYWAMYQENVARWGERATSRYPRPVFERLAEIAAAGDAVRLWFALVDGELAAGVWSLHWNRHAVLWHGASYDRERTMISPATSLYAEVMRDAVARGCRWLDFNPSAGNAGAARFKSRFGAAEAPVLRLRRANPRLRAVNRLLDRAGRVARRR